MKKILIIGKNSFLGLNLRSYLSKYFKVDIFSFEKMIKKDCSFFKKYSHVINTSIHKKYIKNKYNSNHDLDKKFIKRFKKINFIYIFLNSRKIYSPKENISEKSKLDPCDNYAINKLKTENFLKFKIMKNLVSLRISNVIGKRLAKKSRTNHKIFFDNFLDYRKKKNKMKINDEFKDFITIEQFCLVVKKIIIKKVKGVYNVSLSKKIFISEIVKWLDINFYNKITFIEERKDSFTLSNKKLLSKINEKLTKNQLKLFCENIFK